MLDVAPNPLTEPLKKIIQDLKSTKWKFPFILQSFHLVITAFLIVILGILYITIGFVSQISNYFWDVIVKIGDRMSFSNPIPSLFYAGSVIIYFVIFFPFFLIQSPFWISGWITSKIGFKPFLILLITITVSIGVYIYRPNLPNELLGKLILFQDSITNKYFASDSLSTVPDSAQVAEITE